jgi:putative endonuclease
VEKRAHIKLGARGEELAACFLEGKGYTILEKNYHYGRKEIDIIAMDCQILVFVEVKSRRRKGKIPPYLSVNGRKQIQILKVARAYLASHTLPQGTDIRFDVISMVITHESHVNIEHIIDAFRPA